MPPRPSPRVRTAPAPRPNRRGRSATNRIPNDAENVAANETTNGPVNGPAVVQPPQIDPVQLQAFTAQGIAAALAAYETARNGTSSHSGNLGESLNGYAGPSQYQLRSCSLKDFLACKPRKFHGTEGVVGLTRWIEKVEAVFHHSKCSADCRVNYATATLMDAALSWWNDHARSIGLDNAYAMDWVSFKGIMVEEYCPRQEIQKLEHELWNHKMQGSDIAAYTARFNDLASLCPGMVTPEYKKTERYIYGLAPTVQFHVLASRPTTFDSAKRLACLIIEESIRQGTMSPQTKNPTGDSRKKSHEHSRTDNKRPRSNSAPTAVYAATAKPSTDTPTNISAPSKAYAGKSPYCNKCNFHHVGSCMFCSNCNAGGHTSNYCRRAFAPAPVNTNATSTEEEARVCYECNLPGHFRNVCPKLKNRGGPGRAYVIGTGGGSPTLRDLLD